MALLVIGFGLRRELDGITEKEEELTAGVDHLKYSHSQSKIGNQ